MSSVSDMREISHFLVMFISVHFLVHFMRLPLGLIGVTRIRNDSQWTNFDFSKHCTDLPILRDLESLWKREWNTHLTRKRTETSFFWTVLVSVKSCQRILGSSKWPEESIPPIAWILAQMLGSLCIPWSWLHFNRGDPWEQCFLSVCPAFTKTCINEGACEKCRFCEGLMTLSLGGGARTRLSLTFPGCFSLPLNLSATERAEGLQPAQTWE